MKRVFKIEGSKVSGWMAPDDEVIRRPFTEKEPPEGDDILISGYDWVNEQYITDPVVPVDLYQALMEGFNELALVVGTIYEKVFPEEDSENMEEPMEPVEIPEQTEEGE